MLRFTTNVLADIQNMFQTCFVLYPTFGSIQNISLFTFPCLFRLNTMIQSLPPEILCEIFSHLDSKTLVHSASVINSQWNQIIKDAPWKSFNKLQYQEIRVESTFMYPIIWLSKLNKNTGDIEAAQNPLNLKAADNDGYCVYGMIVKT